MASPTTVTSVNCLQILNNHVIGEENDNLKKSRFSQTTMACANDFFSLERGCRQVAIRERLEVNDVDFFTRRNNRTVCCPQCRFGEGRLQYQLKIAAGLGQCTMTVQSSGLSLVHFSFSNREELISAGNGYCKEDYCRAGYLYTVGSQWMHC